jgi:hypothetical protein
VRLVSSDEPLQAPRQSTGSISVTYTLRPLRRIEEFSKKLVQTADAPGGHFVTLALRLASFSSLACDCFARRSALNRCTDSGVYKRRPTESRTVAKRPAFESWTKRDVEKPSS